MDVCTQVHLPMCAEVGGGCQVPLINFSLETTLSLNLELGGSQPSLGFSLTPSPPPTVLGWHRLENGHTWLFFNCLLGMLKI